MNILERIQQLASTTINSEIIAAREKGTRIIGYFCSYVPEEIIHAAGCMPYRMRVIETRGTSRGDAYFSPKNCTFVRHCLDKAMQGDFDFLDGVVFMNGCDHTRRLYDNWRASDTKPDFKYMFVTPHICGGNAPAEFRENLELFMSALSEHTGAPVTPEALTRSINLYNKKRELLHRINDMRKSESVPLHGSEMLALLLAVTAVPVEKAIDLLEEFTGFIGNRKVNRDGDLRIFIAAGCLEEVEHMRLYEDGAVVVADSLCFGARHFSRDMNCLEKDPVALLAGLYLQGLSCPRMMDDFIDRKDHTLSVINEHHVDALVYEKLKFCDLWGWEIFRMGRECSQRELPLLPMERELYGGGSGQIKTRIQAFYEQIRGSKIIGRHGDDAVSLIYGTDKSKR